LALEVLEVVLPAVMAPIQHSIQVPLLQLVARVAVPVAALVAPVVLELMEMRMVVLVHPLMASVGEAQAPLLALMGLEGPGAEALRPPLVMVVLEAVVQMVASTEPMPMLI